MALKSTGYSGKSLADKLGIKPEHKVCTLYAPFNYSALLGALPPNVVVSTRYNASADLIHAFFDNAAVLQKNVSAWRDKMITTQIIWISWPKKSSGVSCDITEDGIRAIVLPMGLVDIKVCAIDATWSALKLVLRKELR